MADLHIWAHLAAAAGAGSPLLTFPYFFSSNSYPGAGGESYVDVIQRIRPIIVELERQRRSVLVVCHLAVQRCLYGYFMGVPMTEIPYIDLPKHVVSYVCACIYNI